MPTAHLDFFIFFTSFFGGAEIKYFYIIFFGYSKIFWLKIVMYYSFFMNGCNCFNFLLNKMDESIATFCCVEKSRVNCVVYIFVVFLAISVDASFKDVAPISGFVNYFNNMWVADFIKD